MLINDEVTIDFSKPESVKPATGQLWSDCRREAEHRIFLVLEIESEAQRAICFSPKTGKISKPRLDRFNRGQFGYRFVASLSSITKGYQEYFGAKYKHSPLNLAYGFLNEARMQLQIARDEEKKALITNLPASNPASMAKAITHATTKE